ncbi:MAG: hypothetical protein Q7S99_05755 [Parvibaculum sp.]|nr:hypothetical protein [Parvibaculum sp.]
MRGLNIPDQRTHAEAFGPPPCAAHKPKSHRAWSSYLMENGEMHIEFRQALLMYLLFQLNLTEDQAGQKPEVTQVALKHPEKIRALLKY